LRCRVPPGEPLASNRDSLII